MTKNRLQRTVRELGGEIWSELMEYGEDELQYDVRNRVVDTVMGVIARHEGKIIAPDEGLRVIPLISRRKEE